MRSTSFSLALLLVFLFSGTAVAQSDRSSIRGTITDPNGHAIPHAHIAATQTATALTRSTNANDDGFYALTDLPLGSYSVTISAAGFATLEFPDLDQAVGQQRTLNVRLRLTSAKDSIDVSDTPVSLNESSDALGTSYERHQVTELPINGRNWSTLTALSAGAVDAGGSNQRTIRFAGRGLDDNDFKYDGVDATNIVNQAQPAFVRLAIPTDSIQEFRVESMLFTADSGQTPGAQVQVASGAGSNSLHGRVFEFLRNDIFDAREPIDSLNPHKPSFRLNQFGGSISGPIVRDRTFIYFTYEGLRQSLGQTLLGFVPTDALRAQVLAQSPALAPLVNAYPRGSSNVNANVARFVGSGKQLDHENAAMLRLDHRFTPQTTSFLRFNIDEAVSRVPLAASGQYLDSVQNNSSRPVNGVAEILHLFSPTLLLEGKFGFNRGTVRTTNLNATQLPYAISVSGLTQLSNNQIKIAAANSFSNIGNATWQVRNHILKFGVEVRRIQLNQGNTASGTISFSSISRFTQDVVNSANYAAALPVNGLRKTEWFSFIQDEYKWKPTLTLNLGLRYEFYNRFHEVLDRAIPFDFATCGAVGFCSAGAEFSHPNRADLDPRVALAWAPARFGNKTVLRVGGGIYHGDGQLDDQNLPIANEVRRYSLSAASTPHLSCPIAPFLANTVGIVSPREMDRRRRDMYVSQWGASVQQALPAAFVDTLSYVGSKGTHLLTTSYVNLIDPLTQSRPIPGFGQVEYRANNNDSSFQGLQNSLQRSFRNGLSLSLNYLWSHEIDNGALGGGDADFPQIAGCSRCERASGDYDVRHTFSANAIYDLPFGKGHTFLHDPGVPRAIFGDWELTTILTTRSGLPINITVDRAASAVPDGNTVNQRPTLVPSASLVPPAGRSISNWINAAAFTIPAPGTFGNAGRNLVRAPGLWQSDLGVGRHFSITERLRLQFRAEVFNLFNRAQYGSPVADISSPNFGRILSTVNVGPVGTGTPRQMQFLLRAEF